MLNTISIEDFIDSLDTGLSKNTIITYSYAIKSFEKSMGKHIDKDNLDNLVQGMKAKYKDSTMLLYSIAINKYLRHIDSNLNIPINYKKLHVTYNSITYREYHSLLSIIEKSKKDWLYWIVKVFAKTGIRYGELRFLTVESLNDEYMLVRNKGRERIVLLSESLCRGLLKYCKENRISKGIIFHARDATKIVDNSYLRRCLTRYAKEAKFRNPNIHPHKFRHLFAKTYLDKGYSLPELADILGHVSLETTRIYTRGTTAEIRKRLESLGL